jgi:hypothetical protein
MEICSRFGQAVLSLNFFSALSASSCVNKLFTWIPSRGFGEQPPLPHRNPPGRVSVLNFSFLILHSSFYVLDSLAP